MKILILRTRGKKFAFGSWGKWYVTLGVNFIPGFFGVYVQVELI